MSANWLEADRVALAADRILDAAGRVFAAKGIHRASLGDVAAEAGCSRPTVYRYFDDRDALRAAFVQREASRLGGRVAREVREVAAPGERLVRAILTALEGVRTDPTLAAWFLAGESGLAADLAVSSPIIESMARSMLRLDDGARDGDDEIHDSDGDATASARWVVRVVLSLLAVPGADAAEERAMLEHFVVPVVVGST